ncbi:MAG: geranylgeranyl pyrophosphate synthase [Alphaproteobacteria bacterium]|nr:geranylgeranyl pyrophosphate synthase [Alphaproteobacteria bacterium]
MNAAELIEKGLERAFDRAAEARSSRDEPSTVCPGMLADALRYAIFAGGARVRPKLCLAVAGASAGPDLCEKAVGVAAAIELIHCASLVHDDLPCFDDADIRRGAPSLHCAFSESMAVLVGDALIVMAFDAVGREYGDDPAIGMKLVRVVARSAGPPAGIVSGQAWEAEEAIDLRAYHRSKTGALFVAACEAGAICVGGDPSPWRMLGQRLGEAYQVADDIRDVVLPSELLGKPAGADQRHRRPSSVSFFGLQGAVEHLAALIDDAVEAVPESPGADALRSLVIAQADRLMAHVEHRETRERRA